MTWGLTGQKHEILSMNRQGHEDVKNSQEPKIRTTGSHYYVISFEVLFWQSFCLENLVNSYHNAFIEPYA